MDFFPAGVLEELHKASYSWASVRQGVIAIALKGIWGAARIGKPVLGAYKRLYAAAASELMLIDSGSSLAAIGMRHSKLAAEVRKALASCQLRGRDTSCHGAFCAGWASVCAARSAAARWIRT